MRVSNDKEILEKEEDQRRGCGVGADLAAPRRNQSRRCSEGGESIMEVEDGQAKKTQCTGMNRRLGGEIEVERSPLDWEIVSFRSCVRAGETKLRGRGERNDPSVMTMTMTNSEKSNICQMKVWPYRQECRGHDPTKKNLLCC